MPSEDWSDWADVQADLSLRRVHSHFVGFVMKWLRSAKLAHICLVSHKWNLGKWYRHNQMPQKAAPDQALHCLLTDISIENKIKV